MLKINDRWFIDADGMQFIVYERAVPKKGKNAGKEMFNARAFCGNLTQLKDWLMNKEIMDNITLLENIEECRILSKRIDEVLNESSISDRHC